MKEKPMKTQLTTREKILTLGGITIFGVLMSSLIGSQLIPQALLSCLILYLITGNRPTIVFATRHTWRRDVLAAKRFLSMSAKLFRWEKSNQSVASIFRQNVARHPNKSAFIMDDKKLTFREIEDLSNQIGNYFKTKNYKKDDTIALFMETRLEYSSMWLGLSKIGVITALINTNLRKETLIHSICVASSKAIIVGSELLDALIEILDNEDIKKLNIFVYDTASSDVKPLNGKSLNLHEELKSTSKTEVDISGCNSKDKLFYIYTSGTTGMPKAAVISNLRFQFMVSGTFMMFGLSDDEIIYNTLPLYHTAGGMLGVGIVLLFGITMALRKKFSASNFWTDCIKYNCTSAQYIGELCRFLLLTPAKPEDTQHKIKFMFGNGLRPQIWTQFVERFKIEQIGEVYGATESNANLANFDNTCGAVGFVPQIAKFIYPVDLVRCDEETGEPIRGPDGLCMRCEPGEPGVFIGKIIEKHASRSFAGYADKSASEKKVIKDVFKHGDKYFNSSDILVVDIFGYYFFKDRTGDTFRWRGENVASAEVEGIVMRVAGLSDCVVYGVDIPNTEGKAGMAAIVDPENKLDLENLAAGIKGSLPPYARPVFIRIMPELPMTGTFKLKKRDLQIEGFDITKIKDAIYLLQSDGSYKRLTEEKHEEIKSGRAKL